MSDDINPVFGLDDTTEEPADSAEGFGTADDYSSDPLGMSEFEGGFPGADSNGSTDPESGFDDDVDGGHLTSAMGTESSEGAEESAGESSSDDSSNDSSDDDGAGADASEDEAFETDDEDATSDGGSSSADDEDAAESSSSSESSDSGSSGSESGGSGAGDSESSAGSESASDGEDGAATDSSTKEESADDSASAGAQPGDLTVSIDGEDIVVGEPTLDITGDGVADTVVVESDGNVEYYVDTDQDGVADQIIVLDEDDGTLVNHEVYDPATGTWTNVTGESAGTG